MSLRLYNAAQFNNLGRIRFAATYPKCAPGLKNELFPAVAPISLTYKKTKSDEWTKMSHNGLINGYLQLSKHRLSLLIASTAAGGYMVAPGYMDAKTFAACTIGTMLMSASANAFNHLLEAPYDAQMKRTQSRVLVVHRFTPLHALTFAGVTSITGASLLWAGCNPLTAALGVLNLGLYAGVYTPLKRYHIGCTWAGAIVGAIPPLMGYAALTGTLDPAAFVLATILYSWQFPHFNGLSWNLRGDYSRAGYRVMCVTDEGICRRTTIRHSLALLGLCSVAAPLTHLTSLNFAFSSVPLNATMIYLSYLFYKNPDAKSSRNLFRFSLLYLPLIMVLMVMSSRGTSNDVNSISALATSSHHYLPGSLKPVVSPVELTVKEIVKL
uniref:Heme O synthase n=1 Tax=Panagrolaimus sp. PS1159 TaxID=55785 RepID=A0AC35F668_9BILA